MCAHVRLVQFWAPSLCLFNPLLQSGCRTPCVDCLRDKNSVVMNMESKDAPTLPLSR